jgi:hypothetical protein
VVDGVLDKTFTAPAGKDYEPLPVAVAGEELISRWTPDEVERKLIADGGDIWVSLLSNIQPPIYVSGEKPIVRDMGKGVLLVGYPTRKAEPEGDPYLDLAKEVRDKLAAIVKDAEEGSDLGCLINCTNPTAQPEVAELLDDVLHCLKIATRLMETAVERIEDEDKDEEDVSCEAQCRMCGCTDSHACPGGCYWVEDPLDIGDLCSQCLEKYYPEVAAKRKAQNTDNPFFALAKKAEGEVDAPVESEGEPL